MKAITCRTYGSADVLALEAVEQPEVGEGDVRVRVHAAGLDPGVWHLMTGLPYLVRVVGYGLRAPKNPLIGFDLAGRVEALGPKVTRFEVGDEVFGICEGSFAELACAPEDRLVRKPARLSHQQAAVVPTSALTALQGLRDAGMLQAGQHVLVIGAAGGVGTFAVQLAKALGADVTGVCSTSKVDLVRSLGADDVIDYAREDLEARGRRYDLILDTAGNRKLSVLRRVLTEKGTLVIVGGEEGGRWLGVGRQLRAALLSMFVSQSLRSFIAQPRLEDLEYLSELLEAEKIRPVLDRSYPLAEVPDAIRYWEGGHVAGKVVIDVLDARS